MKQQTHKGEVLEQRPNAQSLVKIGEREILCYLSGKMKINHIRVDIGDEVEVVVDDFWHLGRIVRRL